MNRLILSVACCIGCTAASALAHDGRRFDIQVINDQLVAQGYISGGNPADDGGGIIRPYFNAIHGHWTNNPSPGIDAASATLPGFDLMSGGALTGFDLDLTLTGAAKWENPPLMPAPGTVPDLQPLFGEDIFVGYDGDFHSTSAPGSFELLDDISASGHLDIDLSYDIASEPSEELYVLEFILSTNAPGVMMSDTVYVILSPDGATPVEKLHHASLYLESWLGTQVPGPGMGALLPWAGWFVFPRRR